MQTKLQILVVGRHEEILDTLLRLLNKNDNWSAQGTTSDENAIQLFNSLTFDLVLLSSGISQPCEDTLCRNFKDKDPNITIIQHYGGGSGLLANEIRSALDLKQITKT